MELVEELTSCLECLVADEKGAQESGHVAVTPVGVGELTPRDVVNALKDHITTISPGWIGKTVCPGYQYDLRPVSPVFRSARSDSGN